MFDSRILLSILAGIAASMTTFNVYAASPGATTVAAPTRSQLCALALSAKDAFKDRAFLKDLPQAPGEESIVNALRSALILDPDALAKAVQLRKMVLAGPPAETASYVVRRTYQDTKWGLEGELVAKLKLNDLRDIQKSYNEWLTQNPSQQRDYVIGRTLDDTAHGYDRQIAGVINRVFANDELGDFERGLPKLPKGPSKESVEQSIKAKLAGDARFRSDAIQLKKMIEDAPSAERAKDMPYVDLRTYQDTRWDLTARLYASLGIENSVNNFYAAYVRQVESKAITSNYVIARTLNDTGLGYDSDGKNVLVGFINRWQP